MIQIDSTNPLELNLKLIPLYKTGNPLHNRAGDNHEPKLRASDRYIRLICMGIIGLSSIYLLVNFLTRGAYLSSYFSADWADTFMDYFNMLENVRQGNPYYANANYPAINFVILKLLFHFVPRESLVAASSPREGAMALRASMPAMLPFIILSLACLLVIALCVRRILSNRGTSTQSWAVTSVLLSGPMVFLLERGNLLLVALSFLMLFFAFWRSEHAWQRALAVVALSIASAMKLYPAAFALLLVADRRWKDFFLTTALGLLFLIAPFFVFGGISAIQAFVNGIRSSSSAFYGLGGNYSLSNIAGVLSGFFGMSVPGVNKAVFSVLGLVLPLIAFVLSKQTWERVLAIGLMTLWVPSFSYTYALTLLLASYILFLESHKEPDTRLRTTLTALCFIVVFSPLVSAPVASILALDPDVKFILYWGCVVQNAALIALFINLMVSGIQRIIREKDFSERLSG